MDERSTLKVSKEKEIRSCPRNKLNDTIFEEEMKDLSPSIVYFSHKTNQQDMTRMPKTKMLSLALMKVSQREL